MALTVAGHAEDAAYAARLRELAARAELEGRVSFLGPVPRPEMPALYAAHDVVVFPSTYDEPFGMVQVEAMACGCAVVGTGTGGSAEIIADGQTGLRFPPRDATALADVLDRLRSDPTLLEGLREGGRRAVRDRFLGTRMVQELEVFLRDIAAEAVT